MHTICDCSKLCKLSNDHNLHNKKAKIYIIANIWYIYFGKLSSEPVSMQAAPTRCFG